MSKFSFRTNRPLGFERLEDRQLMAGNVTAAIGTAGNLVIIGDQQSNVVAVTQLDSGEWKVHGLLGTTTNGKSFEKFTYSGGLTVALQGGNDGFALIKGNVQGALNVYTGNGIDGVALTHFSAFSVCVATGADTDALLVANGWVGLQDAAVTPSGIGEMPSFGTAKFYTGGGNDYALFAKLMADQVSVYTFGGRDIVGLLGVSASESICANLGEGDLDILAVGYCETPLAKFNGGTGSVDIYVHAKNDFGQHSAQGFEYSQSLDAYASYLESLAKAYLPLIEQLPIVKSLPNFKLPPLNL